MTTELNLKVEKRQAAGSGYAWVIVAVTLLAGLSAPLNQYKVPPVMPVLMQAYRLDLTAAGLLMSIFAIMGVILALPAGLLLQRWGARLTGLLALGCVLAGAAIGAFASDFWLLLFSRLVEGAGMGLIAVVGPAVMAMWFPPDRRGLPMGIWATWVPLGSLIVYNLAPWVNERLGWKAIWWGMAAVSLAIFLLFWGLFREPSDAAETRRQNRLHHQPAGLAWREILRGRDMWLLAFAFACYNFVVIGVIANYYPTFLKTVQGIGLAEASFLTSIKMAVCIVLAPFIGWVTDRLGSPRNVILLGMAALIAFMIFPFNVSGWLVSLLMAVLGVIAAMMAASTFSSFAAVTRPGQAIGITIAVVMIGQNVGQLLGPLVFGAMVEAVGWAPAGYAMIAVLALGLAAAWRMRMRKAE